GGVASARTGGRPRRDPPPAPPRHRACPSGTRSPRRREAVPPRGPRALGPPASARSRLDPYHAVLPGQVLVHAHLSLRPMSLRESDDAARLRRVALEEEEAACLHDRGRLR